MTSTVLYIIAIASFTVPTGYFAGVAWLHLKDEKKQDKMWKHENEAIFLANSHR